MQTKTTTLSAESQPLGYGQHCAVRLAIGWQKRALNRLNRAETTEDQAYAKACIESTISALEKLLEAERCPLCGAPVRDSGGLCQSCYSQEINAGEVFTDPFTPEEADNA